MVKFISDEKIKKLKAIKIKTEAQNGEILVSNDDYKKYILRASVGYKLYQLFVNGKEVQVSGDSYTFDKITPDSSIKAIFVKKEESVLPKKDKMPNTGVEKVSFSMIFVAIISLGALIILRKKNV